MIAIVPARGGSKGVPRKNLALLRGKPLIEYTIKAAQRSRYVSQVILSTDDEEIANEGRRLGLDLTYSRPPELAEDHTPMVDTISHCLKWIAGAKGKPKDFMILQPTSPLRNSEDIDGAIEKYNQGEFNSLVSVNEMSEHPYECLSVDRSGRYSYLRKSLTGATRRQDYEEVFYFINGAIYIYRYTYFLNNGLCLDLEKTQFYLMPENRSIDINTYRDLAFADVLVDDISRA